jgi:hypothetical protein
VRLHDLVDCHGLLVGCIGEPLQGYCLPHWHTKALVVMRLYICSSEEDLMSQPLRQKFDCRHLTSPITTQRHNQVNLPQRGLYH